MLRAITAWMLLSEVEMHPLFAEVPPPCRIELADQWRLLSSKDVRLDGALISLAGYKDADWYPIRRMPATVLAVLQDDGVYPDLYFGKNMLDKVPQDLYKQDWWYRTTFTAPASDFTTLEFPGINYRAEIWLNGELVADSRQVSGMYTAHEFNVTRWIKKGALNALAVKVTPERKIQDVTGVELADSWFDWLNWKYLGYKGPKEKNPWAGVSFVPDRNAGIWKPVYLRATGSVLLNGALVTSKLSLADSIARLTVYGTLHNLSARPASGTLKGTITRQGKPTLEIKKAIRLSVGEEREVRFTPEEYPELVIMHPDLWWPYTMGSPSLYDLRLEFEQEHTNSDVARIRFGVRSITQHRDGDESFPEMGKGGNFYLKVNGREFLVRGADYTPDLLYRFDPEREADILRYVKDLGLNFLRWESKISSEHIVELADEQGIPIMCGWMCCNQWEKWDQWDDEDRCVASKSLRSQILMLRPHASAFLWANASDGLPPDSILMEYNQLLASLHWQNAVVNTVSAFAKDSSGNRLWDGIRMEGPYCWRPPSYWFSGKYPATIGSVAEQGDNEQIPTLESLRKFIPEKKLWPINDTWYMHAGAWADNCNLGNIQLAVQKRYGSPADIEDFVRKAQLAHYENARAQFESFAACGWEHHKMTAYWMLNSHWPSFYGNLIDYYLSPGGVYFGAKKGLRPLSVVFDTYATGDNSHAGIIVCNQTPVDVRGLTVRLRVYDIDGAVRDDRAAKNIPVPSNRTSLAMTLPRYPESSPVFFVRCQLFDSTGALIVDNTYWKSQQDDDLGERKNDMYMTLRQDKWSDMTALNTMPAGRVEVDAWQTTIGTDPSVTILVRNTSKHIAFFERATVSASKDGNEILPIQYDDNYITLFPGESIEIHATLRKDARAGWARLEGYNTPTVSVMIHDR